jgi:chemotaxis-related protein WspD
MNDLEPQTRPAADAQVSSGPEAPGPKAIACWNETGVYGTSSCPQLRQFIRCRNCPVYSAAGLQLLNRALPPDYRREWTAHFAAEKPPGKTRGISAILFRLQAEWLAMPTQVFQEVAERRRIHSLPHRRTGVVLGLANVRGELLIAISLGHLLGLETLASPERLRSDYHRLLVANWQGNRFAFPADEVHGPHRFPLPQLKPPPATVAKSSPAYSRGVLYWRDRPVGFLDAELLFTTLNRSLT